MKTTSGPVEGGAGGGGAVSVQELARQAATDDEFRAAIEGLSAQEAVGTLTGDFAAGKLDLSPPQFPGPVAEAAYWDDSKGLIIMGPVGSGKTTTVLKSRIRRAMMMPRSVIDGLRRYKLTVIRSTYRNLWQTTIPDFLEVFPKELGDWQGGRGGPVTFTMRFDDGYGEILFITEFLAFGDDIQGAMRGLKTTDAWLHEADTNPEEVMGNIVTRIPRYPDEKHFAGYPPEAVLGGQLVGDMNAPDPDNWAARQFDIVAGDHRTHRQLADGRISFYRQPGFGEPGCENLQNQRPNYYEDIIAFETARGRPDNVARLVRNELVYTRAGEPVFLREFSQRIHVSDVPLAPWPGVPLRVGLDQGFKGAAVIGQVQVRGTGRARRVRWQILGELHFPEERLLAKVFGMRLADFLGERWPGWRIEGGWADMAGEHGASAAADENDTWNLLVGRAADFRVRPQRIGTNRINPRLEAVRACLEAPLDDGAPGLLIDPSCRFLIAGFTSRYVWTDEVNAQGDKRKVPDKSLTEANVMDALQYLLLSEHRGDGLAPGSFPEQQATGGDDPRIGHNGGPPLNDPARGGLSTAYDVLNPYGG